MIDILSIQQWLYLANVKDYDMVIDSESRETFLKITINDEELHEDALDRLFNKYDSAERYYDVIYIYLEE